MSKIISYARQQTHGVSNPLSGATVAPSNDHTDGSWSITDIYDRELMINTGSATLQFRAGSDITNVVSSIFNVVKVYAIQIGNWDMSTAGATDAITISIGNDFANKLVVGMDAMIYPDSGSTFGIAGTKFKYDFIQVTGGYTTPLALTMTQNGAAPPFNVTDVNIGIPAGGSATNYFRFLANSVDATFTDTSVNRGYIIITYIDII
jgi:hypothetical protein